MKKRHITTLIPLSIAFLVLIILSGCNKDDPNQANDTLAKDSYDPSLFESACEGVTFTTTTITYEEEEMIIHMREEEKLARDVYLTLFANYNMKIFDNIATSEQTHMDKVLCLLLHFGIDDPASSEIGVFNNPDFQVLYDDLISMGLTSKLNALIVGATIEDLDIKDLDDYIAETSNDDIITVFSNLCCGSRNHLRAFNNKLLIRNYSYTPQYISQEYFDYIVSTEHENCGIVEDIMNRFRHRERVRSN